MLLPLTLFHPGHDVFCSTELSCNETLLQAPSNELNDNELAVHHNKPIPRISLLSQAFCFSDGKAHNTTGNKIREDYQT